MKTGIELIADERRRQIEKKRWSAEHDAEHVDGDLAIAAACYALPPVARDRQIWMKSLLEFLWPFEWCWWKPTLRDRTRELVKAGALIAAEIDRINAKK